MTVRIGIVVNPMSGRDVRRLAAHAGTSTHQDKQIQVTRLVLGALEQGVDEIVLADEPFRISRRAVENLGLHDKFRFIKSPVTHSAEDTAYIVEAMANLECKVIIVMGGDGTSRVVAKTWPAAILLPLSTGTNNVFPKMLEPSVAGAAAGIVATGKIDPLSVAERCKQVHVQVDTRKELALVDAVLLRDDLPGNMLPYEAHKISDIILAIAQPAAVGMSPIGGYLMPSLADDDFGVYVRCGTLRCSVPAEKRLRVAISPGLYGNIDIKTVDRLELNQEILLKGPGVLAFDGDREIQMTEDDTAVCAVRRDGPLILDAHCLMNTAASGGILGH